MSDCHGSSSVGMSRCPVESVRCLNSPTLPGPRGPPAPVGPVEPVWCLNSLALSGPCGVLAQVASVEPVCSFFFFACSCQTAYASAMSAGERVNPRSLPTQHGHLHLLAVFIPLLHSILSSLSWPNLAPLDARLFFHLHSLAEPGSSGCQGHTWA